MLHHVALVRTNVSEECIAFTIKVTRIVPNSPILVIMMMEAIYSSEMSVLTRATWLNSPEDGILNIDGVWIGNWIYGTITPLTSRL
jgi:hypothetical protein